MELIVAFNLNSFFNLLVYIAIFSIVLMGYFDKYYMRFIIFILALSIVLDLIWIIVLASVFICSFSLSGILRLQLQNQPSKLLGSDSNSHLSLF